MTEPTGSRPVPLLAELWYVVPPDFGDPALLTALRELSPDTEVQSDSVTVPHPGLVAGEQALPLVTAIVRASDLDHDGKQRPDASQTWDWQGVETTLAQCRGSVLVTELPLAGVAPQDYSPPARVEALNAVLAVLVARTRPAAIYWPASQRVTDPEAFDPQALDGILNVRFFTVEKDSGAMVMDTLGLDLFDLPDLQCHFRDFPLGDVAAMLFSTAAYIFDEGDVIDDGHTISGPQGDERFECRHELSLLDPKRVVIDVDLGAPYAVGDRS